MTCKAQSRHDAGCAFLFQIREWDHANFMSGCVAIRMRTGLARFAGISRKGEGGLSSSARSRPPTWIRSGNYEEIRWYVADRDDGRAYGFCFAGGKVDGRTMEAIVTSLRLRDRGDGA